MEKVMYARFIDKDEAKRIRKLKLIGIPGSQDLVPAFEATNILGIIDEIRPDDIKVLHKLLGGKGSATFILLFIPEKPPVVSEIPFRNIDAIKRILRRTMVESKFSPETPIEIVDII